VDSQHSQKLIENRLIKVPTDWLDERYYEIGDDDGMKERIEEGNQDDYEEEGNQDDYEEEGNQDQDAEQYQNDNNNVDESNLVENTFQIFLLMVRHKSLYPIQLQNLTILLTS
jgi:hypothetical protein